MVSGFAFGEALSASGSSESFEGSPVRRQVELGISPGQPRLAAPGATPELGSGREVLPSLESAAAAPRPMWRHPAFLVSSILALIAAGVLTAFTLFGPGAGSVSDASIDTSSGNAQLRWSATGPVELYSVTGGQALDLTQFVAAENEAWLPAALGLYTRSSCFVIRPAADAPEQRAEVSLDGAALTEQGAASVCMGNSTGSGSGEAQEESEANAEADGAAADVSNGTAE